jgi:hypothetical protein
MIPGNVLSTQVVNAGFAEKMRRRSQPAVDYEMGGIAIADPSKGFMVQQWTGLQEGGFLCAKPSDDPAIPVVAVLAPVEWLGIAFDQSMRVHFTYTLGGISYLYWYDSVIPGFTTTVLPGAINPCICLDEKRIPLLTNSDVIVSYIKEGSLYCRVQRERFLIERLLSEDPGGTLTAMGMNRVDRLQWRMASV